MFLFLHKVQAAFFLYLLLCLLACQTSQQVEQKRVMHIFLTENATFRGYNLGDSLSKIKAKAEMPPKHEDWLGLVYAYQVEKNCQMQVEYYADNVQTGRKSNRLQAIIANIELQDEIEAANLYEEMQEFLIQKYGATSGNFGNLRWEDPLLNLEILLKLHPNKKGITLNFLTANHY
ncbi:MAG: hypothetical protein ACKVTZ_18075 [Bacteroidia bacterium]